MSLSDYVIMPGVDYKAICDSTRNKAKIECELKSGDIAPLIDSIVIFSDILSKIVDKSVTQVSATDLHGSTKIGAYCFYNCNQLRSVEIPSGVNSIETMSFAACNSLARISISDTVKTVSSDAFDWSPNIQEFYVDEQNTNYAHTGQGVLLNKNKTEIVRYPVGKTQPLFVIDSSVAAIADNAFLGAKHIKQIVISKTLNEIGAYSFGDCDNISDVFYSGTESEWLNFISKIKTGNSSLLNATIHFEYDLSYSGVFGENGDNLVWKLDAENTLSIDGIGGMGNISPNQPWKHCSDKIKNIVLGEGVTDIAIKAFFNYTNVSAVYFSNSIVSIRDRAFQGCSSLKKVVLPDSTTFVGNYAFNFCSNLEEFIFNSKCEVLQNYILTNCQKLNKVVLPESITSIPAGMFIGCTSLAHIAIPETVSAIKIEAFEDCSSLKNINLPNKLEKIEVDAFLNSGLEEIIIPQNTSLLGSASFRNCDNLKEVIILNPNISFSSSVFGNSDNIEIIYFAGTEDEWKNIVLGDTFNAMLLDINTVYNYSVSGGND